MVTFSRPIILLGCIKKSSIDAIMNKIKLLVLLIIYSNMGVFNNQNLFAQNRISSDTTATIIKFKRIFNSPYIPKTPGTFYSILVANPAVTEYKGNTYFIFRGQGDSGHDQIGMWTTPSDKANGLYWNYHQPLPIIPVSNDPNASDNQHILDPGVIVKGDSLFVYYTGKSLHKEPNHSVNLAISTDGSIFNKYTSNPIIEGGIAPEVIYHDGLFYLFYQRQNEEGYWEVFVSTSKNGIDFDSSKEQLVFGPSQIPGTIDYFSVTTIRIFKEGNYFYMTYGACAKYIDYPESIGLARSTDLVKWKRYAHNPIFERGDAGSWDEGALWFPTIRIIQGKYLMWYEGAGSGLGFKTEYARNASEIAREQNYGGYLKISFSQIGIAVFEGKISDMFE
jgi:predicted GH43/DUF377 family glycosyl hydrolase